MSTPTFNQSRRVLDFFDEVGATNEQLQNWLGAGDLQKLMLSADLSKVDREAFRALLAPKQKEISWMPVAEYGHKLRDWNDRFRLGLFEEQINELVAKLPDHAGPHKPTGISLTLGKGLKYDREVVQQIIKYELGKLGVAFADYLDGARISYFPGSEPRKSKTPQLGVALLDIGRFWDSENGVVPRQVREQLKGQRLPALEVDWLMALNPQVFVAINYQTVPGFLAAGLVVGSGGLPYFHRGSDGAFVRGYWDDDQWHFLSVVVFREC